MTSPQAKLAKIERLAGQRAGGRGKLVTAADALRLVRDGDTVATSGFVGIGFAENLAVALEERFLQTGSPRGLTLVYAAGQGDGATASGSCTGNHAKRSAGKPVRAAA